MWGKQFLISKHSLAENRLNRFHMKHGHLFNFCVSTTPGCAQQGTHLAKGAAAEDGVDAVLVLLDGDVRGGPPAARRGCPPGSVPGDVPSLLLRLSLWGLFAQSGPSLVKPPAALAAADQADG